MIEKLIQLALRDRLMVLLATLMLLVGGIWAMRTMPLDAIPDLSDVQVIVYAEYPGQAPQVVEDQVTYPLATAMLAVPKAKVVRGYSFFGYAFVYVIFEDGTDLYWARSRVLEQLNAVAGRLPQGVTPVLGPDATGVGWVYEYALVDRSGKHDLAELRSIQDFYLRYELQTVPGVAEVASVGGYVKQYQVEVDPNRLLAYGITLQQVIRAIKRSNRDVGGRLIELGEREFMVRSRGYLQSLEDLKKVPIGVSTRGGPIYLEDVAEIHLGPELRRGLAELNGEGEVVGGIVVMRFGENALETIRHVRAKLEELKAGLPEGVEIVPVYDRGALIERAVASLRGSLLQEVLIVSAVCLVFLLHFPSALVAASVLPLGILAAFLIMKGQDLSANIMSLGGLALTLGTMVDGAIVMIENAHKHLARVREQKGALVVADRWRAIEAAALEVGPALFFSLLVIAIAFLPIFALQAQEGKLFQPLAATATYAMAASAFLAVTLVPVLMGYLLRGRIVPEEQNPLNRLLHLLHAPLFRLLIRFRWLAILAALLLLLATLHPWRQLGSEFMPPLDEGDILYMPTTFPGISITEAKALLQQTDKILKQFPEVESVFGKVGRAETATDPAPLSMIETTIRLKPRASWPDPSKTTQALMQEMDRAIRFPGVANAWTMPIKTRIDMLSTGIKTPVGIKVSGPDLATLQKLVIEIEELLRPLPEVLSVFGDRAVGGYYLDVEIDRFEAARYGLTVEDVQEVVQSALGGMNLTWTVEGLERYPVNLRYLRAYREDPEVVQRILIATPLGAQIPLGQVAEIRLIQGPPVIKSENARPNAWIYVDLKTSDIGGFVEKAKELLEEKLDLPAGYTLTWSGQFEYMERAKERLKLIVPLTLLLIFLLLYLHFRNLTAPLVVMLSIPFALIGGIWLIYWNGYNLSVAVAVGFIALAGMAAEIGVLVVSFIDQELSRLKTSRGKLDRELIWRAVERGTSLRVRPVAMTALSTMAGLLPLMWSQGTGADVAKRIAAPMVGGMFTVMVLSLLILPLIYGLALQLKGRFSR